VRINNFCVVTPNLNMGRYLSRTIESVLKNLSPGDQYFIIDGGSSDNSLEVIRSYEDRITGWTSEPDSGYADAIRKGFTHSNSAFQCWINSGDLLLNGAIDLARDSLSKNNVEMIFGDDLCIDENNSIIQVSNGNVGNLHKMMLYGGWTPLQDACFWRANLYNQVGGIDAAFRYAADFDLFLRMSAISSPVYVDHIFSAFRRHEGQKSIQHSRAYSMEKAVSQKKIIRLLQQTHSTSRHLSFPYYWLLARWRARIYGATKYLKRYPNEVC